MCSVSKGYFTYFHWTGSHWDTEIVHDPKNNKRHQRTPHIGPFDTKEEAQKQARQQAVAGPKKLRCIGS